jgi:hypothetical protein
MHIREIDIKEADLVGSGPCLFEGFSGCSSGIYRVAPALKGQPENLAVIALVDGIAKLIEQLDDFVMATYAEG